MTKLVTVDLATSFQLTRDDGTTKFYTAGVQAMPEADADHYYVRANTKKTLPPALGDHAYYLAMQAFADARDEEATTAQAQAMAALEAWQEKEAIARAKALSDGGPLLGQRHEEEGEAGEAGEDGEGEQPPAVDATGAPDAPPAVAPAAPAPATPGRVKAKR